MYNKQPNNEPRNSMIGREIGPKTVPKAPYKRKSPPPIPSFLFMSLKIKLIIHSELKPTIKPSDEKTSDDMLEGYKSEIMNISNK